MQPPAPSDDHRDMLSREMMAQREQGTRTLGFFAWSLAVCAEHSAPAGGAWLCLMPPVRSATAGVSASRLLFQAACDPASVPSARRGACVRCVDHGALPHPASTEATVLQERDELTLGLRIPLDVALRHGEAGMAREFRSE